MRTTIATSRFNNKTINENKKFKQSHNLNGCFYGTPFTISERIPIDSKVFIIEMNNDENKIEGIGFIRNKHEITKRSRIYEDGDYNRFVYKGNIRLDVSVVDDDYYLRVIQVLEQLLFKGSRHSKRAIGITELPGWILKNKYEFNFIKCFEKLFKKYNLIKD